MKNDYKVLKDFGVTDENSPIYGSHATGQIVDCTDEVAAEFVASGNLELIPVKEQEEAANAEVEYVVLKEDGLKVGGEVIAKGGIVSLKPNLKATKTLLEKGSIELKTVE